MARTRGYKKVENLFVKRITDFLKSFANILGKGVANIYKTTRKKMTVMVVPHSQRKSVNFQVSVFSLIMSVVFFFAVAGSFLWLSTKSIQASQKLARLKAEAKKTQASLDILKNETSDLLKNAKDFQEALSTTVASLGLESVMTENKDSADNTDISLLFNVQEKGLGSLREASELKVLSSYLKSSIKPVEEMGKILNSQAALVSDIPSLWPIKGGLGYVTMGFGQNRHPFTQQWYIHTGIDLATGRPGDPIIATADGQVVTVEYHPGWGNYIIIKHKHGFYTRYAHLQSYRVQRGEHIQQGQTIGYLGNTGISTGAHLHYEVHIGADVVDPAKYLNIKTGRR